MREIFSAHAKLGPVEFRYYFVFEAWMDFHVAPDAIMQPVGAREEIIEISCQRINNLEDQLSELHDLITSQFIQIRRLEIHTGCDKKVKGLDDPADRTGTIPIRSK